MQTYYAQLSRAVGTNGQGATESSKTLHKIKKVNQSNELIKCYQADMSISIGLAQTETFQVILILELVTL